ncbi:MAG: hypothetical protein JKY84_05050 [Emcibacteraceae bacterium]|nr:hypothetical protein [Emcibacteraceae bacterium]
MAIGIEIERKFLILRRPDEKPDRVHKIRQGYIARENGNTVRVREKDGEFILSIKTKNTGVVATNLNMVSRRRKARSFLRRLLILPLLKPVKFMKLAITLGSWTFLTVQIKDLSLPRLNWVR